MAPLIFKNSDNSKGQLKLSTLPAPTPPEPSVYSISLNGTDQYVELPIENYGTTWLVGTLEFWVRGNRQNVIEALFGVTPGGSTQRLSALANTNDGSTINEFHTYMSNRDNVGNQRNTTNTTGDPDWGLPVSGGGWTHVAIVFTNAGGHPRIYINNGESSATTSVGTQSDLSSFIAYNLPLFLGAFNDGGSPIQFGRRDFFDVRLWQTSRTQSEISTNKDIFIESDHPDYSDLYANWRFDEISSTGTIPDSVGSNDATIILGSGPDFESMFKPNNVPGAFHPTITQTAGAEIFDGYTLGTVPPGWTSPSDGDHNWVVTDAESLFGGQSLASNSVGNGGTTARAELDINLSEETTISFSYLVSSEEGYDYFRFYIDEQIQIIDSGVKGNWQPMYFTLPSGVHTLRFDYTKDGFVSENDDRCYIDNLYVGS